MSMKKISRISSTFFAAVAFIGVISASDAADPVRNSVNSQLIESRALIEDDFSGLETKPMIRAIFSWMKETQGDIDVMPPTDEDSLFYDIAIKGESEGKNIFDIDLTADATNLDPWQKGCRHTFYVIRVNSGHPTVKFLDGKDRQIMAFTFTGCSFKFIAIVADRMKDDQMLYTTMLHELGHMWGLKDNKEGKESIMNGSWPGPNCITKKDLRDVYAVMGKKGMEPKEGGCTPEKQ